MKWPTALLLLACNPPRADRAPAEVAEVECRGQRLRAEVAADDASRDRGLAFRRQLADDEALLLVLPRDAPVDVAMKDVFVPLSAAFLDADGRVVNLVDLVPFDEAPRRSERPVRYVVEATRGWFTEHEVGPGERCDVRLPRTP